MTDNITILKQRALAKLERDLGEVILTALHNSKTVEVMVNPDGRIWHEQLGQPMQCIGSLLASNTEAIIKTLAGYLGKEVTFNNPTLEGELPLDGSRFAGQLPPVVPSPCFSIRKKAIAVYTLDDYLQQGIMTQKHYDALRQSIGERKNILVIGGTGSGKTTLVNAIIHQIVIETPTERFIIIEDTGEIQCSAENAVQYHTTVDIDMTKLLKTTLRMRPDRIFVGEVRGPEALDLLNAWNTGHEGGAATLHANSAREGLNRLLMLVSSNPHCPRTIEPLIAQTVHCVVFIKKTQTGRKVQEIIKLLGYASGDYIYETLA